jgi:hypothetical protein
MMSSIPLSQNAAVDLSTGYGVDSFMQRAEFRDPWDRECFVTVVDAAVNYRDSSILYRLLIVWGKSYSILYQ